MAVIYAHGFFPGILFCADGDRLDGSTAVGGAPPVPHLRVAVFPKILVAHRVRVTVNHDHEFAFDHFDHVYEHAATDFPLFRHRNLKYLKEVRQRLEFQYQRFSPVSTDSNINFIFSR